MLPERRLHLSRQIAASAFAVFFLLVLVSENLPASETKESLNWIDKATVAVGFEQGWGVFAPVPASLEVHTYALVSLSDGREVRWDPPAANLFTGTARFERWRKWSTRIRTAGSEHLWETNSWRIAEEFRDDDGVAPLRVRLVRRWAETPPPGAGFDREYGEFMFYEYDAVTGIGRKSDVGGNAEANVVVGLDEELPALDSLPDPGVAEPRGELPNPLDEPPAPQPAEERDPAQSTTQQLDPEDFIDEGPPDALPFVEGDSQEPNVPAEPAPNVPADALIDESPDPVSPAEDATAEDSIGWSLEGLDASNVSGAQGPENNAEDAQGGEGQ